MRSEVIHSSITHDETVSMKPRTLRLRHFHSFGKFFTEFFYKFYAKKFHIQHCRLLLPETFSMYQKTSNTIIVMLYAVAKSFTIFALRLL